MMLNKEKVLYVYQLPFDTRKQLAAILDQGDAWELLALMLPGLSSIDIEACQSNRSIESPTEILLAIWGSKGNSVLSLYNHLGRAKLVRAMSAIRRFVSPVYHHWEKVCLSLPENRDPQHAEPINPSYKDFEKTHPNPLKRNEIKSPEKVVPSDVMNDLHFLFGTPAVKYTDVCKITDNFSDEKIIGKGGFGIVYTACWEHTVVAIKRLMVKPNSDEKKCFEQGMKELKTLSKYRHENILPLYAYSMDGPEYCLIYQYMENGSLQDCLFEKTVKIDYGQRLVIMQGCARALHYLHTVAGKPIIHGDVKLANILLDKHFEAKLGDFGLCLDNFTKAAEGESSAGITGTLAYLSPELLSSKTNSILSDVYAFGIVLLEVSTGQKATGMLSFPTTIRETFEKSKQEGKDITVAAFSMADQKCCPFGSIDKEICFVLLNMGLSCSAFDPMQRPKSFDQIINGLMCS